MDEIIRVLIVDDHAIVREGLTAMLETKPGIQVIGEAADGEDAVAKALSLKPDVILMDLLMPRKDGISATKEIIKNDPHAHILVLSSFSDDVQIVESMRAGAMGYLLKNTNSRELVDSIRRVHAGEMPLDPSITRQLLTKMAQPNDERRLVKVLTKRQLAILPLVAQGLTNKEIGDKLGITDRTAGTHIGHIFRRAGVENRVQLAMLAERQGLIPPFSQS